MRVILVDVGSKIPNAALMKRSAKLKAIGNEVQLFRLGREPVLEGKFDRGYASCVFTKNAGRVSGLSRMFSCPFEVGGYGVNGARLPDEVEHRMPDYSLYGCDFSIGFSTRGCVRNCPWCVVPRMEGPIRDHAPISEFHHPDHIKVLLLDNNLLALKSKFKEDMDYIREQGLKVNFNQGLDIRLVDEEVAAMLADCEYYDWDFNERRLYFAFDTPEVEPEVRRGVGILEDAGIPLGHVMFYMLCGYGVEPEDYTWEYFCRNEYHRLKVLRDELGVDPFVMRYNDRRDIPLLNHFSRYGMRPRIYRSKSFEDYDSGDSQRVIRLMMEQPSRSLGEIERDEVRRFASALTPKVLGGLARNRNGGGRHEGMGSP